MITARQTALETLHLYKDNFSKQQYKTLKGQIYAGDIPANHISSAPAITNMIFRPLNRMARAVWIQGTRIRATTAGRIPLNIFDIHTLS